MSRLVARLSRGLWTPRVLRHTPVDAFQQIAELRRRDRDGARRCRGPDEAATLQPLGEQAQALAVVPQNLDQPAATAAKHKKLPAVRIALELLLHQERQAVEASPHVGMARRQPHPDAGRKRDHDRRSFAASAPTAADTVAASTAPVIRSRVPSASSISITPTGAGSPDAAVSAMIRTGAKSGATLCRKQRWRRHLYNWLGCSPASRASADTTAPGSSDAATSRSFSAELHRRRRSTDVITSTCVF